MITHSLSQPNGSAKSMPTHRVPISFLQHEMHDIEECSLNRVRLAQEMFSSDKTAICHAAVQLNPFFGFFVLNSCRTQALAAGSFRRLLKDRG